MDRLEQSVRTPGWKAFWDRGGWWKTLGVAVVYLALYQALPFALVSPFFGDFIEDDLLATAASVFVAVALPLVVGSIVLLVFAASVRWLPSPLFARQPVRGSGWMWIAPVLVLIPVGLRLAGIDYGSYSTSVILTTFLAGALVGFSEELLTRGIAVTLLRRAGYRELAVAALSSLIFALLHAGNLLSGQSLQTVGVLLVYTFSFGVLMYLVLRVTGHLVWPMVLHALTDPTTLLASGGVDELNVESSGIMSLVQPATVLLIVGGIVLLLFVRGHARGRAAEGEPARD
ncbi:hypothetical protein GCM10028784_27850 [Myceligenerans cantabricum]